MWDSLSWGEGLVGTDKGIWASESTSYDRDRGRKCSGRWYCLQWLGMRPVWYSEGARFDTAELEAGKLLASLSPSLPPQSRTRGLNSPLPPSHTVNFLRDRHCGLGISHVFQVLSLDSFGPNIWSHSPKRWSVKRTCCASNFGHAHDGRTDQKPWDKVHTGPAQPKCHWN
jgi:hypothetical protein